MYCAGPKKSRASIIYVIAVVGFYQSRITQKDAWFNVKSFAACVDIRLAKRLALQKCTQERGHQLKINA